MTWPFSGSTARQYGCCHERAFGIRGGVDLGGHRGGDRGSVFRCVVGLERGAPQIARHLSIATLCAPKSTDIGQKDGIILE